MIVREIEPVLRRAANAFGAVILTGPRRAGKTTVLRQVFPEATYVLLEDPDIAQRAAADPRGFLEGLTTPVILDEIQNVPGLFPYIRTFIDRNPEVKGQWLITGSQEAPLMQGVTESMAGRAAILQLWPFSYAELGDMDLVRGGYPEVVAAPDTREIWFSSYLQTYLERDVRALLNVRDLGVFRRFLTLVASRHGQYLNKSDLAAPLGLSIPSITRWIDVLEATGQLLVVPSYFQNYGKRLVKAPKIYLTDSGMACYLLGLRDAESLRASPFYGPVFEGFVASELVKRQLNAGQRKELYTLRDSKGFEVDFVLLGPGQEPTFIEVKASRTIRPTDAGALASLPGNPERVVLYPGERISESATLVPGVRAVSVGDYFGQ